MALFTPVMLTMVVVAVLWAFVYNADCAVSGWVYAGFYMAIFYAAFAQIPSDVAEAACLDGAGELAIFRRIKVPMIRGAVEVCLLLWSRRRSSCRYVTDHGLLFPALSIITVPMIAVYVVFNRQVVSGITAGSLK